MRKIISYGILTAPTAGALVDLVNASIQKDWQPLGFPTVASSSFMLIQAMVKYEEPRTAMYGGAS